MAAINLEKAPDIFNHNRCMFCATCIRACPTHAIKISYRPKKVPPLPIRGPKSRPGYIDPKKYRTDKKPNFSLGYIQLTLGMMRIKKILKNIKKK